MRSRGHIVFLLVLFSAVGSISGNQVTDFVEPLKNITATVGSNLEFSCSVAHLGNARVTWFHKLAGESMSSILAINGLKITRNPRISLSVFPRSGDITESILYIFNVRSEEGGTYSCGVSTDPMILQRGTLEVVPLPVKGKDPTPVELPPFPTPRSPPPGSGKDKNSSEVFCFNFPQLWRDTKDGAEKFAKSVWEKVTSLF